MKIVDFPFSRIGVEKDGKEIKVVIESDMVSDTGALFRINHTMTRRQAKTLVAKLNRLLDSRP